MLPLTPAASEPLRKTLLRTVPLALIIGTIAALLLRGTNTPDRKTFSYIPWLASVSAALWITFGGHYIETLYLHHVLPNFVAPPIDNKNESTARYLARLASRCAVWAIGGSALWLGAVSTYFLITSARLPHTSELPAIILQGALGFTILELLIIHVAFTLMRRPSAWMPRNGRWG